MFVGPLAVALGARAAEPKVPLGAAVAASFGIDLLWPVFLLTGLETVRVQPGVTAFTPLAFDHYPWSHSLILVVAWAALVGWVGWRILGSRRAAWILAGLVASHWVLDWVTHRPDLPLWPGGPRTGLGLWGSIAGTYVVEGTLLLGMLVWYLRATPPRSMGRTGALAALLALCVLMWASGPWAPAPPSAAAVAWVTMGLWLLPVWAGWADGGRSRSQV